MLEKLWCRGAGGTGVLFCAGCVRYWFLRFKPEGNADEAALSLDIADGGDCCMEADGLWDDEDAIDAEPM